MTRPSYAQHGLTLAYIQYKLPPIAAIKNRDWIIVMLSIGMIVNLATPSLFTDFCHNHWQLGNLGNLTGVWDSVWS